MEISLGEMFAEICAEMQQGAQSPDPRLAVLAPYTADAVMLCPVLWCPFLQAAVVRAPPWDGFCARRTERSSGAFALPASGSGEERR